MRSSTRARTPGPDPPGSGEPIDAFASELTAAVEAVATGTPSPKLSGELARQALRLCHAEIESARTGRTVELS